MTAITPRIPPVTHGPASHEVVVGAGTSAALGPRPVRLHLIEAEATATTSELTSAA